MEWISIKDRLPPYEEWVLLYCINEEQFPPDPQIFVGRSGQYGEEDEYQSAHGDGYVRSGTIITHWMPLPEPPEEE